MVFNHTNTTLKFKLVDTNTNTKEQLQKVTEQQLLGNTGPSKTLDVFLSFLGQSQVFL